MSLYKNLFFVGAAFVTGFLVGNSKDEGTKKHVEGLIEKAREKGFEVQDIVLSLLKNIEGVDALELKENFAGGLDGLKEKIIGALEAATAKTTETVLKLSNTREQSLKSKTKEQALKSKTKESSLKGKTKEQSLKSKTKETKLKNGKKQK